MSLKMLNELLELYSVFLSTSRKWLKILNVMYYCPAKPLLKLFRFIAFAFQIRGQYFSWGKMFLVNTRYLILFFQMPKAAVKKIKINTITILIML